MGNFSTRHHDCQRLRLGACERCERKAARKVCPPDLVNVARRKLLIVDLAKTLQDLKSPPSNKLEALKRDRAGQYTIRINGQYRVCFVWNDGAAERVEVVDYH